MRILVDDLSMFYIYMCTMYTYMYASKTQVTRLKSHRKSNNRIFSLAAQSKQLRRAHGHLLQVFVNMATGLLQACFAQGAWGDPSGFSLKEHWALLTFAQAQLNSPGSQDKCRGL